MLCEKAVTSADRTVIRASTQKIIKSAIGRGYHDERESGSLEPPAGSGSLSGLSALFAATGASDADSTEGALSVVEADSASARVSGASSTFVGIGAFGLATGVGLAGARVTGVRTGVLGLGAAAGLAADLSGP